MDTAADELRALARSGSLVERYPRVRDLLADADPDVLRRAGQLLSRLDPDEVLRAHPGTPGFRVAVTGTGTLDGIVAPLTGELARHGLLARVRVGDFGGYVTELSDPAGPPADLTLVLLDAASVFAEAPSPWRADDVAAVLAERVALLEKLVIRFTSAGRGTLVLNTVPLPRRYPAQLVDHRSRARLGAVWREANARLLRLTEDHPALVVLDSDALLSDGIAVLEPRLAAYTKAHLSPELLHAYAREVAHLARASTGRAKKVLAVDLDGTTWGGILGDDGVEGIEVADTYRGEAFRAFQATLRQLASQGVLLAALSKNDPGPVREALGGHPRLAVREEDFVRVVANWRPKHDNLRELADVLNLGVDSFVFVDDSPYERGLVRRELPGVAVVAVDEEPALHVDRLLAQGWFDVPDLTAEDVARPARYQEELGRQDFLRSFDSVQDYLDELGVRVRVARARPEELARVSQVTLRTNQFNLTTRRLQPADVRALAEDPDGYVVAVHTADRFGDNGLVGVLLGRREADVLRLDNVLLSCRVFARGVEQAALSALLAHARDTGATAVLGEYRPTAKNGKVRDFLPGVGFATVADDGDVVTFRHDLTDIAPPPAHVGLTVDWNRR
ncbi:HAD-IIIC family phosphatase [Saccharothrix syringae]|uniref:HAD-IIIC family phosphatase n=1 Tax=Saccharothrix syringae TaxID=103733 RepID=A0A5Q0GZ39_SACSY|nr:HAD-IIIC family phosphatase [Saccharothrix syringae]QFZ19209.1 HAD-IIIC family phosphatase [Saccharothrix syringae]